MNKLTKEQAIIISAYTGVLCCPFGDLHDDVKRRLGHPVFSHEFSHNETINRIKEVYQQDFLNLCYKGN